MQLSKMEGRKKHCCSSRADKLQMHGLIVVPLPWGGNETHDVDGATDKSMIVLKYVF